MVETSIMTHVAAAGIIVQLLQWAKNSKLIPFVEEHTDMVNKAISVMYAFLCSAGVVFVASSNGGWLHGGGLIHVPPLIDLGKFLIHAIGQFTFQQAIYHGMIKNKQTEELIASVIDELAKKNPVAPVTH